MPIQHIDELRHVGVRDLHVHGLHDHPPHQNRHIRGARREHLRKKHVNNLPPGATLPPAVPMKAFFIHLGHRNFTFVMLCTIEC